MMGEIHSFRMENMDYECFDWIMISRNIEIFGCNKKAELQLKYNINQYY
jgi:hypothetical protein